MDIKIKIISAFAVVSSLVILSGCGLKPTSTKQYNLKLEVWGLFDDRDAYNEIFDNYRKLDPNISGIEYKKLTPDAYKSELVEALASGKGPDIFLIHNNWLPSFKDKITPAPEDVLTEQKFRNDFVDVAVTDFVDQGKIYAVPLSVDSLGLYYNKDLFNEAGITAPPKNWNEFVDYAQRLTKFDSSGQIIQAGASMGSVYNINRSTDVLNLLMMQNQTEMVNAQSRRATFDQIVKIGNDAVSPGENSLSFYTQFAKNSSTSYSWNPRLHYSIDAFSEGNLGMMINYSWQVPTIISKAPKLNFGVAAVPQKQNSPAVNFPNYWGFAVAQNKVASSLNQSQQIPNEVRVAEAWKLLKFMATKPEGDINITSTVVGSKQVINPNYDPTAVYLEKTKKPAARRDLIEKQKTDPWLGVFAEGNLINKDWYQADPDSIEPIFAEMIDNVNRGAADPAEAIRAAAARVTQLMNGR